MSAKKQPTSRKPRKSKKELPSDLTPVQRRIMQALDGRILTKQQLADLLFKGHSKALYRPGGITDLMRRGLVENERPFGYYRPDALPAEFRLQGRIPPGLRIAQLKILNALKGRVLTKYALAEKLSEYEGGGPRYYRYLNLQGLVRIGLVCNKPGFGYYRPDALPAEFHNRLDLFLAQRASRWRSWGLDTKPVYQDPPRQKRRAKGFPSAPSFEQFLAHMRPRKRPV
ncbi:MAG: hypothetical protein ACYC35_01165 [Pirellulales bacterium]